MKKYQINFKVTFTPPFLSDISDFMEKCDLGVKFFTIDKDISWITTTRITKSYIKKMTEQLKKSLEQEGYIVYNTEFINFITF